RVFCDIHSHMNAFILVFSHPYFAVTAADGRFELGRVPPGEYRLAIWHEGTVRETRAVRVRPGAATTGEVDLRCDASLGRSRAVSSWPRRCWRGCPSRPPCASCT